MTAVPLPHRVTATIRETADTVSFELEPLGNQAARFSPGRFAMLYAFGVGEVPISVSGIYDTGRLVHTVRAVGAVSNALCRLRTGDTVGLRGPYGSGWNLETPFGADLLVIAGGLGLAPLRPVVRHALARRGRYGRLGVLIGARTPEDLLYTRELGSWRAGARVEVTVDRAGSAWQGAVGVVTALLDRMEPLDTSTHALVCGPEVMMRHTARALLARGIPGDRIQLSLERNMRCGTGHCGHCQLGPLLLCRDGPVVRQDRVEPLLTVREL
ncbi:FAD/NAD(P)-binding protein [Streptomyces sp. NPDC059209]|uniref:FAD/NAD(P)-binding protein n=1 Tax=Streptomyces sp. NPDC059209 TaxID=3346769 RepID=UPI00367E1619